jgi:hypothetical protein
MINKYNLPKVRINSYGKPIINSINLDQFKYLLGVNVNDIILFEDSTQDMVDKNLIILPRYCSVFVTNKDGEIQFKPYEYDPNRVNVITHNNIIVSIDSIG